MKRALFVVVVLLILLSGCSHTPPECATYCGLIAKWAEQCKKPKFSAESCNNHFLCGGDHGSCSSTAVRCWQMALKWAPDPQVEFNCTTTPVPEL